VIKFHKKPLIFSAGSKKSFKASGLFNVGKSGIERPNIRRIKNTSVFSKESR
jgi:hypothetical protein